MIATEVKYKKTGIDWIPAIPEHWGLVRLRFLCSITTGKKNTENKEEEGIYPFFVRSQTIERINSYSYECEGILTAGDGVGVGKVFHYVNEKFDFHQRVYLLYNFTSNINGKFLFYYLQTFLITELMRYNSKSTVDSIRLPILKDFFIPIPPQNEQSSAIEYIDSQTEKISHFIQTKLCFIELLKEQRQSIITNAVTKGIDEKAKMKETVLGEIPEHWEMRRLGTIGRFSKGGNISRSELIYTDEGVPAILYGDLYTKYDIVVENIINCITKETAANSVELKKGDLLFTGSGETKEDIGKCVIFNSDEPAYAGGDVIIFKQNIFDSYFISYSQNSSIAKYQKAISSKGEIIVHTYGSKLCDVIMPYPPSIEEQNQIVEHIKTETKTLDIAISKAEREIELIKEYREAMIAEAVTGRVKVY